MHQVDLSAAALHDLEDLQIYLRDRQAMIQRTSHGVTLAQEVERLQGWRETLIRMLKEAQSEGLQLGGDL